VKLFNYKIIIGKSDMASILKSFFALYLSKLLLSMSLGLLATFLSLRLTIEGFSTQITGIILTAYFVGSVVGAIYCRRIIRSVGHIRAFTAFAALATAMIMLHGCYISALAWAVFRFFSGIATIGNTWMFYCRFDEQFLLHHGAGVLPSNKFKYFRAILFYDNYGIRRAFLPVALGLVFRSV